VIGLTFFISKQKNPPTALILRAETTPFGAVPALFAFKRGVTTGLPVGNPLEGGCREQCNYIRSGGFSNNAELKKFAIKIERKKYV